MTAGTARQKVLVVGGAGGIGSAVAEAAATGGATVWLADDRGARCAAEALPGSGHRPVVTDVTDAASFEALIEAAWSDGGPDGIVYAPGLLHTGDVADIEFRDLDRVFAVNLFGAFTLGRAVARRVRTTPKAVNLVFVSSVAGLRGEPGGALYCATKFGLLGFVQSFAAEIAEFACRANVICPGNVSTPMLHSLAAQMAERAGVGREEMLGHLAGATAPRRLLSPAEVANVCLWLLSPRSSGISGQALVVDGPAPRMSPA